MDITSLVLDLIEQFTKIIYVFIRRPYATVRVQFAPQKDKLGQVTKPQMAITIINESVPEIDIQRVWFLSLYNRIVESESLNAKMPVKILKRDRAIYFFPIEELKAALNKNVQDNIAEAVAMDKQGHKFTGRLNKAVQAEIAR